MARISHGTDLSQRGWTLDMARRAIATARRAASTDVVADDEWRSTLSGGARRYGCRGVSVHVGHPAANLLRPQGMTRILQPGGRMRTSESSVSMQCDQVNQGSQVSWRRLSTTLVPVRGNGHLAHDATSDVGSGGAACGGGASGSPASARRRTRRTTGRGELRGGVADQVAAAAGTRRARRA